MDVGICLPIYYVNQEQLESVLEHMTACLPFTSLEEAWHSILDKLKCIKIESKETHNYRDTDFQESEI